ncbi:MAG: hypothetical protein U9O66_00720 [Patescibacteria group bacterium]|nr:hypothetical protein [Patescibacteria group bacterium]
MDWKKIIITGIILAIVSGATFFMSLSFIGGGSMMAIGAGLLVLLIWFIFTLFFVPIATYFIFKKFDSTQQNQIEIFLTTIFCFLLISIPFLYILHIEHLEEIEEEKSHDNSGEFYETYTLAINNIDPTFCDKLKSTEWIEKEKLVNYNNESMRTYERCCFYSSDAITFNKSISEEKKWKFCMKMSGHSERQGCYSDIISRIDIDKRKFPINFECDTIEDDNIKKECIEIDERTKAEEKAFNPNREDSDLTSCDSLNQFHKAVCYSYFANSRPSCFDVCNQLSSEIIISRTLFMYPRNETQRELCENYCKIRERRR